MIYRSYDYFVKEIPVKNQVFEYIERGYERKNHPGYLPAGYAALVYQASDAGKISAGERAGVGGRFPVPGAALCLLQKFEPALIRAFQLQDKSFIEYRTNPRAAVSITYYKEDRKGKSRLRRQNS